MPEKTAKVDLLGRQPFVNEVLQIINAYASDHRSACYAINGIWGSGKTFVLNLLEKELQKMTDDAESETNFLVLRYNCWEYDYYDEPLLSIVATMQKALEDATNSKLNSILKDVLNKALKQIAHVGALLLDSATNGISTRILNFVKGVKEDVKSEQETKGKFDDNLPVLQAVQDLRNVIKELSEKCTVIFLVDELDRCLPEYAIRVLERLHHIYIDDEPTDNVQVIFSVDREQLEHVVKQLYGEQTNAAAYLQKFISFEINLHTGSLNQEFDAKFDNFINMFDNCPAEEVKNMMTFKARILDGYDIRRRIAFVDKADLVHRIVGQKEIDSYFMLCVVLFLTIFSAWAKNEKNKDEFHRIKGEAHAGNVVMPNHECFHTLAEIYKENKASDGMIYHHEYTRFYIDDHSLYGAVLCAYRTVLGVSPNINEEDIFFDIIPYADKAWKLLTRLQ